MAYDLLSGRVSGKSFSRSETSLSSSSGVITDMAWNQLPWRRIAIASGAALGAVFVIPRLLRLWDAKQLRKSHGEWDHEETKQIPRQRMKSLVGVED